MSSSRSGLARLARLSLGPAARVAALALPLFGSLAGCLDSEVAGAEDGVAVPVASLSSISQNFEDCGFACGDNGGVVDGVFFWELNLAGLPNAKQVKYRSFARSELDMQLGNTLRLDVEGARLRALNPNTGLWLEGLQLEGGVLLVTVGTSRYFIKIAEVHTGYDDGERYWTKDQGKREFVETYDFRWAVAPPPAANPPSTIFYQDVCAVTTPADEPWKHELAALVFEGDRYDIHTKLITPSPTTPFQAWFNIACAGSLPAKMHLTRRTSAASDLPIFSSAIDDDRQAMARMWAADYCGDGTTFTVTGHKLRIRDHKTFSLAHDGWIPSAAPVGFSQPDSAKLGFSYEAVWGPDGAVCLDTPRLVSRQEIEAHCGYAIPKCSSQPWFPASWRDHGQVLSANPSTGGIIIAP